MIRKKAKVPNRERLRDVQPQRLSFSSGGCLSCDWTTRVLPLRSWFGRCYREVLILEHIFAPQSVARMEQPPQHTSSSTICVPTESKKDGSCIICFEQLPPEVYYLYSIVLQPNSLFSHQVLAASPKMKCCHDKTLCKQCWEQYLTTEFDQKKKSPLLIICPSGRKFALI